MKGEFYESCLFISKRFKYTKSYCGASMWGIRRKKKVKWTEEQLKYYLTYVVNGNSIDTMFKGLIFNPIVGRKGHSPTI